MPTKVRLNKFLRDCHLGSRRKCEQLIVDGLVTIGGQPVTEMATLVDPEVDRVAVGGHEVKPRSATHYIAANKPRGAVVTANDPRGRVTLYEAIPGLPAGIFSVGRLDLDSEGLILLTNDGTLGFRLAHPKYGIERVYEVSVEGSGGDDLVAELRRGVVLEDGIATARQVEVVGGKGEAMTVRITLTEGRKREVRRMLGACGYEVRRLRRTRFGSVELGHLDPGKWRYLTREEVRGLRRLVEQAHVAGLDEDKGKGGEV
ncbi:MAG: pseudouridine synthase [bacterium]